MILRKPILTLVLAAACSAGAATTHAAPLPAGSTAILSGGPTLFDALPAPVGYSSTTRSAAGATGRYVAFQSHSDGLVAGDDDSVINVYVKDRTTGAVTLASRENGVDGQPSHGHCYDPAISDDGRRVAFTCSVSLAPGLDTNGEEDVYVRDVTTGATILVSRAAGLGPVGDRSSYQPALSGTGEFVAFVSSASNFGDPANAGARRVYRRRIGNGDGVTIVSRQAASLGGEPLTGSTPTISDSGDRIGYATEAPAVGPFDGNNTSDVYVLEMSTGEVTLASRATLTGPVGNGSSQQPSISGNGSFIAFESAATNLSGADPDTRTDIYRRRLTGGSETFLVSMNAAGVKARDAYGPSMDTSGVSVAFVARSGTPPLHPDDTRAGTDAYVKNIETKQLQLVSRADGAAGAVVDEVPRVSLSGDGLRAVMDVSRGVTTDGEPRRAGVVVRDLSVSPQRTFSVARPGGDAPFRNAGGTASGGAMSTDGRYVAFRSESASLGVPDDAREGIFVRDRVTGSIVLVSRADGVSGAPFKTDLSRPVISADGRRVAFTAARETGVQDVWVRDVASGRTMLASVADGAGGTPGNDSSVEPVIDADGSHVAFSSYASNLHADDKDGRADIFVRHLADARTVLVSRADGPAGVKSNAYSYRPDINADGSRVIFLTEAANLTETDKDTILDVHLRDVAKGTTTLVSADGAGVKSDGSTLDATIDSAGNRVAFSASSTNLLGAKTSYTKVFVRDLANGSLVLAGRADGTGGAVADANATDALISPEGGYVAFASTARNLGSGGPEYVRQVFRRDLASGRTDLVSRGNGPAGAAVQDDARPRDINDRGRCVTFTANDAFFGGGTDNRFVYVRAFVANCGDPEAPPVAPTGGDAPSPGGVTPSGSATPRAARDLAAPVISQARLARRRFRVARGTTALAAAVKRGTTLTFRSSEAATLTALIERVRPRTRTRRRVTYGRTGTISRQIRTGAGRVALTGRLSRRRMAAGRYRLTLAATDAAGNRSKAVRLTFTIVRG